MKNAMRNKMIPGTVLVVLVVLLGLSMTACANMLSISLRPLGNTLSNISATHDKLEFSEVSGGAQVKAKNTSISGEVIIPDTFIISGERHQVITIATNAFNGCTGITSVHIPATMHSIGPNAFSSCTSLTSVTILCDIKITTVFNIYNNSFPGNFTERYLSEGPGTYTRPTGTSDTWTKVH